MFLYRAVDEKGRTVASYLSQTRDQTAARLFFRQALKRHGEPRSITLDGFEPSHCALRAHGYTRRLQLLRPECDEDSLVEVFEQHRRTGSSPHKVPGISHAGLQIL
jgi:transposase-like protein